MFSSSPSTETAYVLSSPANSPQRRTCGKFIPDHTATTSPPSQPNHSFKLNLTKARATAALKEARDMSEHYSTEFSNPQETPEKLDFKKKIQQDWRRDHEHRQLVDEIVKLDNHDQIDRLLTEFENLKVQTEMQGKAMNALHGRSVQNMQTMHMRLAKLEEARQSQTRAPPSGDPQEADKDAKALEDLVKRVESVEEDGSKLFVRNLKERVKMDDLQERVWVIEDGIEDVRMSMADVAKKLGVQVEEGESEDGAAEEPGDKEERRDSVFTPPSRKRKAVATPGSASASKRSCV